MEELWKLKARKVEMFVNISNHPTNKWGEKQLEAAKVFGDVRDINFPNVPATATSEEVVAMAEKTITGTGINAGDVVMCQGEFSLTYAVTSRLLARGVKVVVACSERSVQEVIKDGVSVKTAVFEFVKFRQVQ
jgi:hypothetical protein